MNFYSWFFVCLFVYLLLFIYFVCFYPPPLPNAVLDDVNKVMDELKNVLACYEGIGGRLDLPNNTLEVIHGENLSAAAAMRRVIVEWLNRNYPNSSRKPPTWKVLVDAVEHPLGGNNRAEAEEIANRHRAGESGRCIDNRTYTINDLVSSGTHMTVPSTINGSSMDITYWSNESMYAGHH